MASKSSRNLVNMFSHKNINQDITTATLTLAFYTFSDPAISCTQLRFERHPSVHIFLITGCQYVGVIRIIADIRLQKLVSDKI